jgi:ribosomal protein S18 acetylase RimI-like enzyme
VDGDISIRKLQKKDLNFLLEVRNSDNTRFFLENTNKFTYNECLEWFENKKPNWFIILYQNNLCGYIRTDNDDIKSISIGCDIHENYRNKGIAKTVYRYLLNYYKEKKYEYVWLYVFEFNLIAYNLYKKLGFVEENYKIIRNEKYIKMKLSLK